MSRKQYFDGVNIAKLILALAIVAMHSAWISDHTLPMTLVCRLGVPYFFVASGFFLQRKCAAKGSGAAVKAYIGRLLLPYAVFSAVWILQLLIDDVVGRTGLRESVIKLLQYIVFYPRGALWYVWASILGALMLLPFLKRKKLLLALPLGVVLFAVGLLANNYYFLAAGSAGLKSVVDGYLRICLVSNNAVFVGFVFLLIGMLMSEYYDKITEKIGVISGLVILILSCILLLCEESFIESRANGVGDGAFYLSQLAYVPAVFYLTTRTPCPHLSRDLTITAKNLSTGIYFLHVPILWIIHRSARYLLPQIHGLDRIAPLFDHPSVCFFGCVLLCLLVCLLAYRRPKSFLCKILK